MITLEMRKEAVLKQYRIVTKKIEQMIALGWNYGYLFEEILYPEVVENLAKYGYDVEIDLKNNIKKSNITIFWYKAEKGRKGEISYVYEKTPLLLVKQHATSNNNVDFIPDRIIMAYEARKATGQKQYENITKAREIKTKEGIMIYKVALYNEVAERFAREGHNVEIVLKDIPGLCESKFYWDKAQIGKITYIDEMGPKTEPLPLDKSRALIQSIFENSCKDEQEFSAVIEDLIYIMERETA
ncbi:MAG: hypothetical protein HFJ47_03060 [Clostridia bacterium]|nr:hypothetical protein [Clostridia bacterium]